MNSVGIDVSKGTSTVMALRPMGEVALMPREVVHTAADLESLGYDIISLGENTRVVMEATGRYHRLGVIADPRHRTVREPLDSYGSPLKLNIST